METSLNTGIKQALEDLQNSYRLKAKESSSQSIAINTLNEELASLKRELRHKNDYLELLDKESKALKKQLLDQHYTKAPRNISKETIDPINAQDRSTLLGIHLNSTKHSSDKWEHYFQQYEKIERQRPRGRRRSWRGYSGTSVSTSHPQQVNKLPSTK